MSEASKRRLKRICVWIPEHLHKRLRDVAEVERRTMAATGIIAIEQYIEEFEAAQAARKK